MAVDLEQLRHELARWFENTLAVRDVVISDLRVPGSGFSNETVFLNAAWTAAGSAREEHHLVLRKQPEEALLFPNTDVLFQHRVLEAWRAHPSVPVPRVVGVEADAAVIGAPFYVMEEIVGHVLLPQPSWHQTGWAVGLSPDERELMFDNALAALAEIHRVEWRDGFEFLAGPSDHTALECHMDFVADFLHWAAGGRNLGVLDEAMQYVTEHVPDDPSAGIVWGDAQIGNMLIDDDCSIAAVLDWELATLGPAEIDVGWWLMFDEYLSGAVDTPRLDGIPDRQGTIDRYEQHAGRTLRDIRFHEILAAVKLGGIIARFVHLQLQGGVLSPETTMATHNPVTQMLARWLDLEVPSLAPEYEQMTAAAAAAKSDSPSAAGP
jgi:aminoglycoside phosphotransferase (APT) family kinase protein